MFKQGPPIVCAWNLTLCSEDCTIAVKVSVYRSIPMVGAGNTNCYEMVQIDYFAQIHFEIRWSSMYYVFYVFQIFYTGRRSWKSTECISNRDILNCHYFCLIIHFPNFCFFLHVTRRLKAELQNSSAKEETTTKTKDLTIWVNCYCWEKSSMVEGRFSKWF